MKRAIIALTVTAVLCVATVLWAGQSRNKVGGGYIVYASKADGKGPAVFSHLAHGAAGAGYACTDCHTKSATARWSVSKFRGHEMKLCAVCHGDKAKAPKGGKPAPPVSDCRACHMPAKDTLIKVDSIGSVPFSHMQHTGEVVNGKTVEHGGLSCGACHPDLYTAKSGLSMAMTYPHGGDSCGTCHNDETQSPSGKVVFTAHGNCARCHKKDSSVLPSEPPCRPYAAPPAH